MSGRGEGGEEEEEEGRRRRRGEEGGERREEGGIEVNFCKAKALHEHTILL